MDQPHGFQAVHARHEDIEKQQIESFTRLEYREPLAAIAGDDNAVAGPFQQNPDGRLHCNVIVHDQNLCQVQLSASDLESTPACRKRVAEFAFARKHFHWWTTR